MEAALGESDAAARRTRLEAAMGGYSRNTIQPRRQPARRGGWSSLADIGDDSLWGVRRHLESTDFRRWPPALQALLRRLYLDVATAQEAEPRKRNAAAIRLARLQASSPSRRWDCRLPLSSCCVSQGRATLSGPRHPQSRGASSPCPQDSCPADLEPLLGDAQMQACLLSAPDMPDKPAVARFLASLVRLAMGHPAACLPLAGLCGLLPALPCDNVWSSRGSQPTRPPALHRVPQMTKSGLGGLAGAALPRIQAFLPAPVLEELCGDLLSTAGLQTSAWQHTVCALLERGTPGVRACPPRLPMAPTAACGLAGTASWHKLHRFVVLHRPPPAPL